MTVEAIAKVCHEANRAYCEALGDLSQKPWGDAEDWQRESAIKGVRYTTAYAGTTAKGQHEAWRLDKTTNGWVYGAVKDAEKKTHPSMVPFEQLPEDQRRKDALFIAIVSALHG